MVDLTSNTGWCWDIYYPMIRYVHPTYGRDFETRQKAEKQAIEKAFEILEERLIK